MRLLNIRLLESDIGPLPTYAMYLGALELSTIYLGSTGITQMFLGSKEIEI